ncbi:hypothetical protein H0H92_004431 [Tricholoma furcatifolium]|nr:hypothetical protein H0H92_004431 [Tricholoma furcatifolium]
MENEPAMCNSYLSSPLDTILASLDDYNWDYISCHDITEAYNILSARMRSIAHLLCSDGSFPAFNPLKEHANSLARALKRDIRRALIKPSSTLYETPALYYDSYASEISLTDFDIQHALDVSTLCHHSLYVLSAIFTMENLHVLFSRTSFCLWVYIRRSHHSPDQDLNDLLNEILKIALAIEPPIQNATKTASLVFSIIQTQTLPRAILEPQAAVIVKALRDGLNGQKGVHAERDSLKARSGISHLVSLLMDLLQAIYSLSQRQPSLFAIPVLNFLLPTLMSLTSDDTGCRMQACNALCGIVLAKFKHPDFPHESISNSIHTYMKPQIPKDSDTLSQKEFPLHYFLFRAYGPASASSREPVWAVITIAALIILSDRFLYGRHELAFCAQSFTPALKHKRQEVRQLATAAWSSLVWTFSHLPAVHRLWRRPEDPKIQDSQLGIRGRAFRMLMKPMVDNGKGVLLTRGLLFSQSDSDDDASTAGGVSRALLIVRAMINGSCTADSADGVEMLCRLLGTIKPMHEVDDVKPSLELFHGELLEISSQKVVDVAGRISNLEIDRLRALSEAEIMYHWQALLDTWVNAVERTFQLRAARMASSDLLDIWQSLLLVKTDLSQGLRHLTAATSFASQIANVVTRFVAPSQETSVQVQRLTLVKRLWGVMKNVFSTSWLPAERILAGVLKVTFSLDDEDVRGAWSDLCTDLISVGVPTLLHVISTGSEGLMVTRHLWTVLARTWQTPDENAHWEELVSFLVIPFRSWVMCDVEFELWDGVLGCSIRMAASDGVEPFMAMDRLFIRLGEQGISARRSNVVARLVAFPRGVLAIMSLVDLSGCSALPQPLLSVINQSLVSNYPPRPELLTTCLEVIRLLHRIIHGVPQELLVDLLCSVEKGVCCWIGDEKEVMLTREHNTILLRKLPQSLETLIKISPFLSSAFSRQTSAAIGPLSFNEFWRASYHGIGEYRSQYPDCLKACLLGFSDAYGGSIAEGLSMSQETFSPSIPDSQPLNIGVEEGWFSRVDLEAKQFFPIHPPSSPSSEEPVASEAPMKRKRTVASFSIKGSKSLAESQSASKIDKEFSPHPWLSELSSHRSTEQIKEAQGESQFGLSTPRLTPGEEVSRKHTESHKRRKTELGVLNTSDDSKITSPRGVTSPPILPEVPFLSPPVPTTSNVRSLHDPFVNECPSPSTEMPFSSTPSVDSVSQTTETRKRKRIIDWVDISRNLHNSVPRSSSSQIASSEPSTALHRRIRLSTPTSEDYDTWEAGAASMAEIRELQQELSQPDDVLPETDIEEDEECDIDRELGNVLDRSQYAKSTKSPRLERYRRSQTVPHHTTMTPLKRARTISSGQFDALEQALNAVTDSGSQIPVEDLIQASEFVTKMQGALNRQLGKRLAKSEPSDNG